MKQLGVLLTVLSTICLSACGGSGTRPQPSEGRTVTGQVVAPAGVAVDGLSVVTPFGVTLVGPDGTFSVNLPSDAQLEFGVETADGELLLLGVDEGDTVTLSLESTAEALLYYAVGGMWLSANNQQPLRTLLRGRTEVAELAAALEAVATGGGNGLADGDARVDAALQAAHASLVAGIEPADLEPAANNILINPTGVRFGAELLHADSGVGVVIQNHLRRPAGAMAYETAWTDADGGVHDVSPPRPVALIDVPATSRLELLTAIGDVLTGNAPWTPVLSPEMTLPVRPEAASGTFEVVLLGPSLSGALSPIMSDSRFATRLDQWDEIINAKTMEMFLDQMVLPAVQALTLGHIANVDAAKLAAAKARILRLHDPYALQLGLYLKAGGARGYADALRYLISEMVDNRTYRTSMLDIMSGVMNESDRLKANAEAFEKGFQARASASAITAALETALVGGDVARTMHDLASTISAINWTVEATPALFALAPGRATVTKNSPSIRFTASPRGKVEGNFLFRWSTSGKYGALSDLLSGDHKSSFVTDSREVWYFHDAPARISNDDVDTVTLEVFMVDEGVKTIPPGAEPVARQAATVRGLKTDLDADIVVTYGVTTDYDFYKGAACVEMFLRIPYQPGAGTYTVSFERTQGVGDPMTRNDELRTRPNYSYQFRNDGWPDFKPDGIPTWKGPCVFKNKDGGSAMPTDRFALAYDPEEQMYMYRIFHSLSGDFDAYVRHWYDVLSPPAKVTATYR